MKVVAIVRARRCFVSLVDLMGRVATRSCPWLGECLVLHLVYEYGYAVGGAWVGWLMRAWLMMCTGSNQPKRLLGGRTI